MVMSIAHILKDPARFTAGGKLWIEGEKDRFLGPGRVELLEAIQITGSINKAAKTMNMSYKKAWEMIAPMNHQSLVPLVVTHTGGKEGGGAELTPEAHELIAYFKNMHLRFQDFLAAETEQITHTK